MLWGIRLLIYFFIILTYYFFKGDTYRVCRGVSVHMNLIESTRINPH